MSEELNIQTEKLQRFIDGEISLDELSIEKDILEVIFVLRPELSPKPKVLIDDIWKEYQRTIETKEFDESDSVLILESPLPLPKIKIEDIFSALESGPLMTKEGDLEQLSFDKKTTKQNETVGFVSTQDNVYTNVIAFSDANKKTEPIQNNRWQLWTGILVAASVLFVLLPSNILNSYESSIPNPTFSKSSEKKELYNSRENNQQKNSMSESSFEQELVQNMNSSQRSTKILERVSKSKPKKTNIRKNKAIAKIDSETISTQFETSSSDGSFFENKQIETEFEAPLVSTDNRREDIQSDVKIIKEVDLSSTTIANGSFDGAPLDKYDVDIGAVYEERNAQVTNVDENIEEIDIIAKKGNRPSKRSKNDLVSSKRRSKSGTRTSAKDVLAAPVKIDMAAEKNLAQKKPEPIRERDDLLEKQLEEQGIASNVLIKIQIYDVSDSLEMSSKNISFQYGTQNAIPYKSTEGFWVFSIPATTVGKLVIGNIQSDAFFARDRHICRMVDQKLICE